MTEFRVVPLPLSLNSNGSQFSLSSLTHYTVDSDPLYKSSIVIRAYFFFLALVILFHFHNCYHSTMEEHREPTWGQDQFRPMKINDVDNKRRKTPYTTQPLSPIWWSTGQASLM